MELGLESTDFATYFLLYGLFSLCILFPPQEFNAAGFTIPKLFSSFLGDERFDFILYNLKRVCLTIFLHLALPLCFCITLELGVAQPIFSLHPQNFIQYVAAASVLLSIGTATVMYFFKVQNWERHPVVQNLKRFNSNWKRVAEEINEEYRAPIIYSIFYNAYSRVSITSNWIVRISNYNVVFARIEDSRLFVVNSNRHPLLSTEDNGHQLIDIRVESVSKRFEPFFIRVYSNEMLQTLRDQIGRPIEIAETFSMPQPLHERFDLEPCLGCSNIPSSVKLTKNCVDNDNGVFDLRAVSCQNCQCRPMWCAACVGRIFASKQDQNASELWLSGRAPCPTCRSLFCVLDVSYID